MALSRRSQPYRRGAITRLPGRALSNMVAGKPLFKPNPMNVQRQTARMAKQQQANRELVGLHPAPPPRLGIFPGEGNPQPRLRRQSFVKRPRLRVYR